MVRSKGEGVSAMGGLIIITLLAGGMLELIRYNGGIDYIINLLTRHVSGKRGAEFSIAALVGIANICYGEQYHRYHNRRTYRQEYIREIRAGFPQGRQPPRYLLLCGTGYYSLRRPAPHGFRSGNGLSAQHYPVSLLSSRTCFVRYTGYTVPLS